MDSVLMAIYDRFGPDVLLLPWQAGKPVLPTGSPPRLTLDDCRELAHQNRLTDHDVAIPCGSANGGLYGLIPTQPGDVALIQELNPPFKETLITEGIEGTVIWFRAGDLPLSTLRGSRCLLAGEGSAVVLRQHPPREPHWKPTGGPIVQVDFAAMCLAFDPRLQMAALDALARHRQGAPFLPARRSPPVLNPKFWADYLGHQLNVGYRPRSRCFVQYDPETGQWQEVPDEVLMEIIGNGIRQETQRLKHRCHPGSRELRQVLAELRIQFAVNEPDLGQAVTAFVVACVRPAPGGDVTTQEMHTAYNQVRRQQQLPVIAESVFERLIGRQMEARLGLRPSHSLERQGHARRGFRGIRLAVAENAGTLGTLGTEGAS